MFRHILIAVDGSDASQKAVDWAKRTYAELPQSQFTFVHVQLPLTPFTAGYPGVIAYPPTELPTLEEDPAYIAWDAFDDKDRVRYERVGGNPSDEILKIAEEQNVDLIVLGSEGHGLVSSVLLGSVSAKVLHHAKRSVLIVR